MFPEQQQIHWYSGLYLQPQHFQSLDLHNEWLQAQIRRTARPYNYGVVEWGINQDALTDFVIDVQTLSLIMPSGIYLANMSNCRVEKRSFRDAWKQRDQPFTLWLALRKFNPRHNNVTLLARENDRALTRWINTGDENAMKDIYDHGPEAVVPRLLYNVSVLWDIEKEDAVDCECIPLLRLCYNDEGVVPDPTFSPPTTTLYGSPSLGRLLDSIYFELSHRARKLEEYKRPEGTSRESGSEQPMQLLAMRSLNRVLPLLSHYCAARDVHPWQVYGLLSQLVGELSSFDDTCSFSGEWRNGTEALQPYHHMGLFSCFDSMRKTLIMQLNGLILEENTYITLESDGQGIFTSSFDSSQSMQSELVLLLLRSASFADAGLSPDFDGPLKLASRTNIDTLIQHALPGVPLSLCRVTPRGVPNRSDSRYFTVQRESTLWLKNESHKSVAFYWPDAPEDLLVQIIFKVPS